MYSSTGIGPSRRMRSRNFASNPASPSSARALDIGRCRRAPAGRDDHPDAERHHRQGRENAGTQGPDTKVRLAVEFAKRSREAIAGHERSRDDARLGPPQPRLYEPPEHGKKEEALEPRLVELARVTRVGARLPKYECPGHIGRTAPQLGIDEI